MLQKLLPDFTGRKVLDLGCGYGWHCQYAVEHGAAEVVGVDSSRRMLSRARELHTDERIAYRLAAMESLDFPAASFHVVLSSLAFHYVADFPALVGRIAQWLRPGGSFVFSVEHPVFTSYGTQDWWYGPDGTILHFPVDRYFEEGPREAVFLGETMTKYHRTLTTYLQTLLEQGLVLRQVVEPRPPQEMMDLPGMREELRRPMMLLVGAEKPGRRPYEPSTHCGIPLWAVPAILYGADSPMSGCTFTASWGARRRRNPLPSWCVPAAAKCCPLISPEHGERCSDKSFAPWDAVPELENLLTLAQSRWDHISLRATSLGAWFSLLAFAGRPLEQALLVSPVLDMERLIRGMMAGACVSEEELRARGEIPVELGETLSWRYLQYARTHPPCGLGYSHRHIVPRARCPHQPGRRSRPLSGVFGAA